MRSALGLGVLGVVLVAGMSAGWAQTADDVLAGFEEEPTVLEVQQAALDYNQIDQGVMSGWSTRANIAPILPRFRVDWRRVTDDDIQDDVDRDFDVLLDGSEIPTQIARDQRTEDDTQDQLRFQGDWQLGDLIFNPELLRVSNERSDMVELREDILTTVTTLYFERRRAQVQMVLEPPADAVDRLRAELEVQELTAGIDGLTGGWFSQELSAAGLPTY